MFVLLNILVIAVIAVIAIGLGTATDSGSLGTVGVVFLVVYVLAVLIPSLAVQVRRFHDQDKSGWFVLLGLIPYIGGLSTFVFMLIDGTPGPNQYGDDPKARNLGGAPVA